MSSINIPLSLYVHFPWCVQKCPYCDFNSHTLRGDLPQSEYQAILLSDLQNELEQSKGQIQTIFFGGGTPSLVDPETIHRVIETVRSKNRLSIDAEITLEANPGSADTARFDGYKTAGVNRLSIGIQSLNTSNLKNLGRVHSAAEGIHAVEIGREAGFDNINLDMMFGLPEQTRESALHDLLSLINLRPEHISYYQLTLEPNTPFYNTPPKLPVDDDIVDMHEAGLALLEKHGFHRYEVSAFATKDNHCRHNINYWLYGDYIGIGAGAHGKITTNNIVSRYSKPRHPKRYQGLPGPVRGELKYPNEENIIFEFLLNALRLPDGFTEAEFSNRTGLSIKKLLNRLQEPIHSGLMLHQNERIKTTITGFNFLNELLEEFLPDER